MWRVVYHKSGTLNIQSPMRDSVKHDLDEQVKETTQGECWFTYVDYPNMSDIITHTPENTEGMCIGAIVWIAS